MYRVPRIVTVFLGLAVISWSPAGTGFKGVIRDTAGKPVAGAWIEARHATHTTLDPSVFEGEPTESTRSDAEGAWSLTNLEAGNWIVTAVGSRHELSDVEMKDLARSGAKGAPAPGIAVTRCLRHVEEAKDGQGPNHLDLGLAMDPMPDPPLHGRLVGAFDPVHFGYEVQYKRVKPQFASPGMHTVTVTLATARDSPGEPLFAAVPSQDGQFDFGGLAIKEAEYITVTIFSLKPAVSNVRGVAFYGTVTQLNHSDGLVEVPLPAQRMLVLRAQGALERQEGEHVQFSIWNEQEGMTGLPDNEDDNVEYAFLPAGTYLVRAELRQQASPIMPLRLNATDEVSDLVLTLAECPRFTVHLVDQTGKPLESWFLTLGTKASAEFPFPCRVRLPCVDGTVKVASVIPGTYNAFFKWNQKSFTQELELRPDKPTVAVLIP